MKWTALAFASAVFVYGIVMVGSYHTRRERSQRLYPGSDLQNVKAHLEEALPAGQYTLKVYTRSGLSDEYGVHVATRKVVVG